MTPLWFSEDECFVGVATSTSEWVITGDGGMVRDTGGTDLYWSLRTEHKESKK